MPDAPKRMSPERLEKLRNERPACTETGCTVQWAQRHELIAEIDALNADRKAWVEAEAKPETPVLRRWPIGVAGCAVIANDGTMWRESISLDMWVRVRDLPQPREDGGE